MRPVADVGVTVDYPVPNEKLGIVGVTRGYWMTGMLLIEAVAAGGVNAA